MTMGRVDIAEQRESRLLTELGAFPTEREQMATPFTHRKLADVKDSGPDVGLSDIEVRFANDDLDGEQTGISHHRLKPGIRQPFGHRHEKAEEVYVVVAGSGRMKLDDEIIAIETLDAIRVAPTVTRGFEAGPDGLEIVATGTRHDGDGEIIPGWWGE
jgi:mannose-6-phosphate isomerase-like protein (cupin superfamily)